MAEIPIYGTLVNATTDPKIINTDQAWDKELGKYQSEINKQSSQNTESLREELTEKINQEVADRKAGDIALETNVTKVTGDLATEVSERKAADTALGTRIDNEVTARTEADTTLQTNIDDVQDNLDNFIATKGKANGLASLGSDGKVPAEQLPSYVDDVIDVYATYDVSATNEVSNIKLYTDADHTTPVVGEAGKSYNDITTDHPGYQFRWSGTAFVQIVSGGLIIGEITGTAYDGGRGRALKHLVDSLPSTIMTGNTSVSESSDKVEILLDSKNKTTNDTTGDWEYRVNVTHILRLKAATTTKAGVMTAVDRVKLDTTLPNQISDEAAAREAGDEAIQEVLGSLPNDLVSGLNQASTDKVINISIIRKTKNDSGQYESLGNTSIQLLNASSTKAGVMSAADKVALDALPGQISDEATARDAADTTLQNNITKEVNDRKGEIVRVEGLISDEEAARTEADTEINTKVDLHIANKSNPHGVTKAQVGLGNVNNTSDADKPVSTAQATAIADAKAAGTNAQTNLNTHIQNVSNPHNVTRDQLGMGTTSEIVFKKVSAPSGLWKESDERLKTFIKPLEHTLDEICSIPTDSFLIRGTHDIGTIAQSIEKHFPELVSENTVKPESVSNPEAFEKVEKDGETYILVKEVDYSKMSVLAIEGIKLLKQEIDELKKQLLFTNLD